MSNTWVILHYFYLVLIDEFNIHLNHQLQTYESIFYHMPITQQLGLHR